MANHGRQVELTPETRARLERLRDTARKPYQRERATAILKVADGWTGEAVASYGLLRPRDPKTVYRWLDRYEAEGLDGVTIRPGRGRQPAFSPPVRHCGGCA